MCTFSQNMHILCTDFVQVCSGGCWRRLQTKGIIVFSKTKTKSLLAHFSFNAHHLQARDPRRRDFSLSVHIFRFCAYAQNMHILENMHISRKVASARLTCSQIVRVEKNVNQWVSNFCFEKNIYPFGLQPAPTAVSTNLHKKIYVL